MVMRLLPWARKKMVSLPQERAELQRDVRAYIHKVMCLGRVQTGAGFK